MTNLEHKIDLTLLSRYDFEVDPGCPNERLTCIVCNHIMIDAYQTYCGCKYCRQCILKHMNDGPGYCRGRHSDCREEKLVLDYNVFRNPALNRKILKLRVICPYEFCGAITEHCQMGEHMKGCPQRPIECPYSQIGCDSRMASSEKIETHLHTAMFAHSQLVVASIKELRAKFDLSLEYQKNESIMKNKEINEIYSKMEPDKSEAIVREARRSEEMRALKAESGYGGERSVTFKVRRSEEMDTLKAEVGDGRQQLEVLEAEVHRLKEEVKGAVGESMDIRAEAGIMRTRMDTEREEFRGMREEVERLQADVGRMGEELTRFQGDARVAMLEEDLRTLRREGDTGRAESRKTRAKVATLEEEVKRVSEGTARMETENAETRNIMMRGAASAARTIDSLNIGRDREGAVGELWFTVYNIAERMWTEDCSDSPHFYSHANGYKLRIHVYPRRRGSIHVSSVVCKGEFDAVLPWPCRFTLSVAMVHKHTKQPYGTQIITYDSDTDNQYSKKPIDSDNPSYPPCISPERLSSIFLSDIRSSAAIVDDSLLFHVVVGR